MDGSTIEGRAEFAVLSTEAGRSLLAEIAACASPGPADLARWRKQHPAERVAAALRLVAAQRKARGKLREAERLWLTPTGAEQATAEPVARHKAARFATVDSGCSVVDLCCGVGGDAIALAEAGLRVLAVDLDGDMARRVAYNARVVGVGERVLAVHGSAERFGIPDGAMVHVDPDRRAGRDRRARDLAGYAPGPEFLKGLMASTRGGAIKLGPASDFETLVESVDGVPVEVELISLDRECKEATLWYGALAGAEPRRATALPSGASLAGNPARSAPCPVADRVGPWVFDPDPALVRAGLVGTLAGLHGLARVPPGNDYLTGPRRVETPWLAAFEVLAVLPMDRKRIGRAAREAGIGPLEVKARGVSIAPEAARTWVRPTPGGRPATLLLCGGRQQTCAVLATRPEPG